jgi:alkylation response protein AidB-like acyl-CoA dehydrogenase
VTEALGTESIADKFRDLASQALLDLPLPGKGATAVRHHRLAEIAREDLTLARLAEAHADALAILAEAGRSREPGALYGVWASELPDRPLRLEQHRGGLRIFGTKMFCSGAGIVDRALVTARVPEPQLVEIDLLQNSEWISYYDGGWITPAFAGTKTATAIFDGTPVRDFVGCPGWYLNRPGFWHGACGPASCWAGGAMGILDYALLRRTENPHTVAHLGAMEAAVWAMKACLEVAGHEIDDQPRDQKTAVTRALSLRHVIEQFCVDILQRFGRACGPRPLAFDRALSRRYQEVELYIRQCHAERDLESLGKERCAQLSLVPPSHPSVA